MIFWIYYLRYLVPIWTFASHLKIERVTFEEFFQEKLLCDLPQLIEAKSMERYAIFELKDIFDYPRNCQTLKKDQLTLLSVIYRYTNELFCKHLRLKFFTWKTTELHSEDRHNHQQWTFTWIVTLRKGQEFQLY